jgi:hypothetical protein
MVVNESAGQARPGARSRHPAATTWPGCRGRPRWARRCVREGCKGEGHVGSTLHVGPDRDPHEEAHRPGSRDQRPSIPQRGHLSGWGLESCQPLGSCSLPWPTCAPWHPQGRKGPGSAVRRRWGRVDGTRPGILGRRRRRAERAWPVAVRRDHRPPPVGSGRVRRELHTSSLPRLSPRPRRCRPMVAAMRRPGWLGGCLVDRHE